MGKNLQEPSEKTWKSLIEGFEDISDCIIIAPELKDAKKVYQADVKYGNYCISGTFGCHV